MFDLIFTPLRRVILLVLVALHVMLLFFLMQRFEKAEARAFLETALFQPRPSPTVTVKKPRIPLGPACRLLKIQ